MSQIYKNSSAGGGTPIITINGNTGSLSGSSVTIRTGANDGTAAFANGGSTSNLTFDNFTSGNIALGNFALNSVTSGEFNAGYGATTLQKLTTGFSNFAGGIGALKNLTTGSDNVVIGESSGSNYTSSESNNIIIGQGITGTTGDQGVTTIGNLETTSCFILGIDTVNVGSTATVVTEFGNQLGTAIITAGTGVTITPSANAITISASAALITAPPSSNTATTAFGTTLTSGTPVQNTLGYDILLNISISITAATTATITMGVGPTTGPTTNTAIPSFSAAAATVYALSAVVPTGYWIVVNHTGTITVGSITVVATPL